MGGHGQPRRKEPANDGSEVFRISGSITPFRSLLCSLQLYFLFIQSSVSVILNYWFSCDVIIFQNKKLSILLKF